jgi:hypothetical protein
MYPHKSRLFMWECYLLLLAEPEISKMLNESINGQYIFVDNIIANMNESLPFVIDSRLQDKAVCPVIRCYCPVDK